MPDPRARLAAVLTGRYRIEGELGAGGMATVYLAEDTKHHRRVAVKMLKPELALSVGAERFLREIEIAAGLHHPHILPLHDSGGADGVLYYVMPFVDGQSLRDRIAKVGALPVDESIRTIREVVDALAYSHAHGVVHRDIKPENILLTGAHALVTDFGIAKAISDASGATQLTSAGMAMGTPSYMAPEQIMADPSLDHRVDIYAVGVMAYEMLAGRTPFAGANAQQIIAAHLARTAEPLSVYRDSVSPALEAVIMRCLEKNPADRWQSASDLLVALDTVITSGSAAMLSSGGRGARPSASFATPSSRKRTTMIIGAGVIVVAFAVAGLAWFSEDGRAGTLIGNDVLAANDLVLVSEFQNRTTDSTLAATVTDAVRVELQQSRVVKVMSQAAMWVGIRRMGLTPGAPLAEGKVQELAEREGAKAFVVGDIARLGEGYQLTARVLATAGGSEALTVKATAANDSKLIEAVEELGHSMRKGIGESLRSVRNAPSLAQVTTASLPALRIYTEAIRAGNSGEVPRAIALAKQALLLDTAFAGAWSVLYVVYANSGQLELQADAATHAFALRDRLSEVEALRITARYHAMRGETAEEEAVWQRFMEMGREHTNYANMLLGQRRFADAEAIQRRGVEAEPRQPIAYWNLLEAQAAQQKFAAAESTVSRMRTQLPGVQLQLQTVAALPLARRDFNTAESYLNTADGAKLRAARPDYQCTIDLQRGRLKKFASCSTNYRMVRAIWALAEFRLTGDTLRARHGYQEFLATAPETRSLDVYSRVIAILAELGRVREARQLLDEWRRRTKGADPTFREDSTFAIGSIAAAEKQWDRAATAFLMWNAAPMPSSQHFYNRGLAEAATALMQLGKLDSSVVLLERALSISSTAGGIYYEAGWYAQALQQLGDAYSAKGDRAKAAGYYTKYVELLRDADPPIAAQVAEVKAKLVKLRSEPGPTPTKVGKP